MKKSGIFAIDVLVSIALVAWCKWGPWIGILGFSTYHSRGDVWLPRPAAAISFFRDMVAEGTLFVVLIFLAASVLAAAQNRESTGVVARRGSLVSILGGRNASLFARYSALIASILVSPYLYDYMWRFHTDRTMRVIGGASATIATLVLLLIVLNILSSRADSGRAVALTSTH